MRRGRIGFDEWRSGDVLTEKISVVVVERGDVEVQILVQEKPVTSLIAVKLLGMKVWIWVEASEERQSVDDLTGKPQQREISFRV